MTMNRVILIGNAGASPETKIISDTLVANFSIATTERGYTTKNGIEVKEVTDWHNITCWRGLAEIASKYIQKGTKVMIEGKVKPRSYEKDGVKHYSYQIIAENIELLSSKPQNQTQADQPKPDMTFSAPPQSQSIPGLEVEPSYQGSFPQNDDLPF